VVDRRGVEDQLNQLRPEIATLLNLPVLSPEFTAWLDKLFVVVKAGFGVNSDEMRQLRAISPELPSEFYDSVAERLGSLVSDEDRRNQLLAKLHNDVPQTIFRRRLHEYDDLIGAMIHGLQRA
jgi:hypothetical protein